MKMRLVILAVLALALIPSLGGCINDSSIVGDWIIEYTWAGSSMAYTEIEFLENHTFVAESGTSTGTWSLSGKNIEFILDAYPNAIYVGTVNSNGIYMSGTMSNSISQHGTWEATKGSGTLSKTPGQPALNGN